ncbi:tripartite tricarboxylate transporter TctB family protein [Bradyrhizobium cajani]|uniref:Tripartite tricarboxylate transporter TctB family protein n=2 Tax=Bradyrhizobium cajani TaxID=1928661 RepID=A0A844T6B8_9BRAD|nr:tripartite tricarboxylate transporter TctB family protein [Bradyrhizobium cajani]
MVTDGLAESPPHPALRADLSPQAGRGDAAQTFANQPMSQTDLEIVVDDPTAPEDDSPSVVASGTIEIIVCLLLLALAVTLGYDNWRTGASWDATGPEPGYFPFYLSVILGGGSLYGLIAALVARRAAAETFVTRAQARRVMAVFVPTLLFCLVMQYLGLYVASFLLISGFMRLVGKIALWKSLLTAFVFTAIMFVTFDIAFDVIMPKGPLEAAFGR